MLLKIHLLSTFFVYPVPPWHACDHDGSLYHEHDESSNESFDLHEGSPHTDDFHHHYSNPKLATD